MFNVTDFLNTFSSSSSATTAHTEKDKLQRKLRSLLQDDSVQILSSFELNQWATLTYHEGHHSAEEDLCEALFETLQSLLLQPTQHTHLTLQKALVVARHVLLVGAEKVIQEAQVLRSAVAALRDYNTALIQQQSTWLRFKGGVVDEGGPVRELAERVFAYLSLPRQALLREREKHADPNSLVPVGSNTEIAFATDEQRLYWLQQRMQHQQHMQQKSNLAKADNGFGGGYSSRDGQSIVGASHSLEEMMEIARRKEAAKKKQFRDEPSTQATGEPTGFVDYEPPFTTTADINEPDLLDWQNPTSPVDAGTADLLDFSDTVTAPIVSTSRHSSAQEDLLSLATNEAGVDPFAPLNHSPPSSLAATVSTALTNSPATSSNPPPPEDPFAAFDALGPSPAPKLLSHATQPISHTFSGNHVSEITHSLTGIGISNHAHIAPLTKTPLAVTSSLQVSWRPANAVVDEDDDGGFLMGGVAGSGLEPLGMAPAAPPPPPPPSFY